MVGGEKVCIGLQTFHAAAKHEVCGGAVLFVFQLLQQLVGAALYHLNPDAGAGLKFLDNGPPYILFVGGIDHQPFRLIRGKILDLGSGTAAQQQNCGEKKQKKSFHRKPFCKTYKRSVEKQLKNCDCLRIALIIS